MQVLKLHSCQLLGSNFYLHLPGKCACCAVCRLKSQPGVIQCLQNGNLKIKLPLQCPVAVGTHLMTEVFQVAL